MSSHSCGDDMTSQQYSKVLTWISNHFYSAKPTYSQPVDSDGWDIELSKVKVKSGTSFVNALGVSCEFSGESEDMAQP